MGVVAESFDAGPDGGTVTTDNTVLELVTGSLAFFATPARSSFGLGAPAGSSGDGIVGKFPSLGLPGPAGLTRITAVSAWFYLNELPTATTGTTGAAVITVLDETGSVGMSAVINNAQTVDPDGEPGYLVTADFVDDPPAQVYLPVSEWFHVSFTFTGTSGRLLVAGDSGVILDYTHTFADLVALTAADLQVVNTDALPVFADDFVLAYDAAAVVQVSPPTGTRRYPRDDAVGATPRRYPPTRAGRRVGGYS